MTVLSAIRGAAPFMGVDVPTSVFGQSGREAIELQAIANACAQEIAMLSEWQKPATVCTLTGDGATESFNLPADYHWIPEGGQVWSSALSAPLSPISDRNEWLGLIVQGVALATGLWIIFGDQMHIRQALPAGATARFVYQSNLIVKPAAGANKTTFTADTDTFRLDEELLRLAIIWRWRLAKELPYAEHLDTYETRKSQLIARDRGPGGIRVGSSSSPLGATLSYPRSIIV